MRLRHQANTTAQNTMQSEPDSAKRQPNEKMTQNRITHLDLPKPTVMTLSPANTTLEALAPWKPGALRAVLQSRGSRTRTKWSLQVVAIMLPLRFLSSKDWRMVDDEHTNTDQSIDWTASPNSEKHKAWEEAMSIALRRQTIDGTSADEETSQTRTVLSAEAEARILLATGCQRTHDTLRSWPTRRGMRQVEAWGN